ncbi:cyanophycin synthetase [Candidatus Kaiserbacteria bacterium CG10_big_fil_rev_8_21_14_0_10_51_14]|uniref:Cyanophycin synthetase n=1 Tax=Candidatus Kaiserbacteria bacterium CG10_big_fil_rev_8_21_14_0_10_51_14 TaxID=1974610 RepID=A0A2H0UC67_9BACT|nr:MAG: cyanophycin synthetase [Candidatus Kaiserbacteria bacterium CG10_big_fil_rev_8_21_14_0_10_51_14]
MIPQMKRKPESLVLAKMLQRLAPRIGAKVVLEPEWNIAGQIRYKNGKNRYFRYNTLDLNPVGAADISKDKDYATFFMRRMGYHTIPGKAFYSDEWCETIGSDRNIHAAYRYAKKSDFPVIVKPNSGSQGVGVALVHSKQEFFRAMKEIFKGDKIALVQRQVCGKDYRIVVLDNEIISAYERIPLNVIGDGRSTIRQLLTKKARAFHKANRDTQIKMKDSRIANKLKHQGLTMRSIPRRGERVFLLDNANLSSGGDSIDVTKKIHPELKKIAIKLTKDMGLRMCGVDLMVDGDIANKLKRYWILETNAAPGLDHYVKSGKAQQKIVEDLYLRVLKSMAR